MSDRKPTLAALLGRLALLVPAALAAGAETTPDPTRPPAVVDTIVAAPDPTGAPLDLSAVFHSEDRRVAIIDGRPVRERQRIGSARVLRIEPDRVELERDGERFELRLLRGFRRGAPTGPNDPSPTRARAVGEERPDERDPS